MTLEPFVSRKTYVFVFVALLALLAISILAASLDLGTLNATVALTIAILKALLIALYFMHLRYSAPLTWVVALGGAFWLGILLVLTMSDYLTRGWLPIPAK
jgi:cytochrome c oxidase subunit 4